MIYQVSPTTPQNTALVDAVKTTMKISLGFVYQVEIIFPSGSAGLLRCNVFDGLYQLWPSTPFEWFQGDDTIISFPDSYLKLSPPSEFQVYTYNTDDTFEHQVFVRVGLVSKELFMARFLPTYAIKEQLEMMDKLERLQEQERQQIIDSPFSWIR